ncbi:MAG: hypothetical protein J5509_02465 [Lachnospiraceae bacterium]|nr:hypothetical protein [Lachnospiraceae bacterium]
MRISESAVSMASSRTHLEYANIRSSGYRKKASSGDTMPGFYQEFLNQPMKQLNQLRARNANMSSPDAIRSIRMQLLHRIFDFLRGAYSYGSSNVYDVSSGEVVSNAPQDSSIYPASVWKRGTSTSFTYYEEETTSFSSSGIVRTADGREIAFGVEFSMSRAFCQVFEMLTAQDYFVTDPLVINLDTDMTEVSDFKFLFDLDCDGVKENISFAGAGSGFLALDLNEDGVINDGSELFGTKSGDGFADLAKFDSDGNGWIDEADEIFEKLRVWTKDENGNDMLISLKEADVGAICLGRVGTQFSLNDRLGHTNAFMRSSGVFLRESGGAGTLAQLDLTS